MPISAKHYNDQTSIHAKWSVATFNNVSKYKNEFMQKPSKNWCFTILVQGLKKIDTLNHNFRRQTIRPDIRNQNKSAPCDTLNSVERR